MTTRVRAAAARLWARFWFAIDEQQVSPFMYVFGIGFIFAGIYGPTVAHYDPPLTLQGSMTPGYVAVWYWLLLVGPALALIGKSLKGRLTHAGLILQLTGDMTVSLALLAYVVASFHVETWGHGAFGPFLGSSFCAAACITITHDVRALLNVERTK